MRVFPKRLNYRAKSQPEHEKLKSQLDIYWGNVTIHIWNKGGLEPMFEEHLLGTGQSALINSHVNISHDKGMSL